MPCISSVLPASPQLIPSEETVAAIEEDVCQRRDFNPPPPRPKYFMPSVIQPDLKYMLAQGQVLPAPPQAAQEGAQGRVRIARRRVAPADTCRRQ